MKVNAGSAIFVVVAVLCALGFMAIGAPPAAAQSEDNPAEVEAGMGVYAASCAGCHGEDGTGSSRGRPLTDIAQQGDRATHFASVADGKGSMPAFGEQLSDEQIDAALSYVRLTFVSSDAADDSASSEELAKTGAETPLVAVAGVTLIAAGAMLVQQSRRKEH